MNYYSLVGSGLVKLVLGTCEILCHWQKNIHKAGWVHRVQEMSYTLKKWVYANGFMGTRNLLNTNSK